MSTTVLVEPHPGGHRFQWTQWVASVAQRRGDHVVLLTSRGGSDTEQFHNFLAPLGLEVDECFEGPEPGAEAIGQAIARRHRDVPIAGYVVLDSDQMIKRWWRVAPPELRNRRSRPEAVIVMTRFPPRPKPTEGRLMMERLAKAALCLLARVRGVGDRFLYVAPRNESRPGLLFKRLRDPALCSAHSRDRGALRERLELDADRRLVSVLGSLSMRKNPDLVLAAACEVGPDVDLLLAGVLPDDVRTWLDGLDDAARDRVLVRPGFLSDDDLDAYVAASDIVVVAHSNPGPSGLMGKAQAAGVPVVSAGSTVRRREAEAMGVGVHTEMSAEGLAEGMRAVFEGQVSARPHPDLPSPEEFGRRVLGEPDPPGDRPGSDRAA